ncbi:unnamed protein product [Brassica napus]|uniref:(rape) hypothetical protein n=1 Tax=Brassica napus TaxID=3708 RepID=A0A817A0F3_BRANA|nr:unnamed protein product [Brassica napus]
MTTETESSHLTQSSSSSSSSSSLPPPQTQNPLRCFQHN